MSINKDSVIRSAIPISNKTWENFNGANDISPNAIFELSTLEGLKGIVKLAKKVTVQKDPNMAGLTTESQPPLTLDSETVFDTFRVSGVVAVGHMGQKLVQ
ncbi:25372_t:CDS:2, partial [Dentiscutata erythropus]